MRNILEEFQRDLENLTSIMESDVEAFVAPGNEKDRDKQPGWQKDTETDTILNDCNAADCLFYNEGFKNQCMLKFIEIDPQHGCSNYKSKADVGNDSDTGDDKE